MSLLVTWRQSRNLRQTLFIIALITLFTIVVAKGQLFHCKEQVVYFYVLRKVKVWKIIFSSEPILNFEQSLVFLSIRLEVNFKNLTLILEQSWIGCNVCQLSPKQESMNSHASGKSQIDIKCRFGIWAFVVVDHLWLILLKSKVTAVYILQVLRTFWRKIENSQYSRVWPVASL